MHAKDELEFATNWRRSFTQIYQHLKWLNAFALINEIAMQKIIKKFMKVHFELSDNVIDKKLRAYIESKNFSHRSELQHTIEDLKYFFAQNFTNGSESKARDILDAHNRQIRKNDLIMVCLFGGGSIVMTIFAIFFTLVRK
jgi:hypothetical protein